MRQIFKDARKAAYLNPLGADKPLKSPIPLEVLKQARANRKRRMVEQLQKHDCAAILLYDPVNIRYALDVSNMQVWMLHNPSHYALVFADGKAIDFEYKGSEIVAQDIETIDEVRPAKSWFYFSSGDRLEERMKAWAAEIVELMKGHGGRNMRLAVDKCEPLGIAELERHGVRIIEGQELTEHARAIKSPEEIELMKWTIRVCEAGMARMYENSLPGKTENEIWAELHYENIRSGGEWIETRLLATGPRTNPWFQECSDRVAELGDICSFDTDLIGPYGYCADLSRSWTIGHSKMTNEQKTLYSTALEQINHNMSILKAGMSFAEYNEKSWRIPEKYQPCRYSCVLHGVGLADEYPSLPTHPDWARAMNGRFEENMTVCIESLMGEAGGRECMKLETQVLLTKNGVVRLDSFPWEEV
ncbi:MAG: aminopeptidase P family protein [Hyphomicrobiaceae bacterium]|nr:MAG: aminopeptidase P family protein [Hyphomicrobiaceae bacterium]